MPEIRSDVPLPVRGERRTSIANLLCQMHAGDSVEFDAAEYDPQSVRRIAHSVLGKGRYTTRIEAGSIRVWRTK